jgi:hypothetical protein
MGRFTAVIFDVDADTYFHVICSAPKAEDVEEIAKKRILERAVEKGDLKWSEYADLSDALDNCDVNTVAVFAGDHPNLIENVDVVKLVISEGWQLNLPDNAFGDDTNEETDDE